MDKPEKTVNGTGTSNSELKDDDDEDYNFMNNLSPITTIDLSGVFSDSFQYPSPVFDYGLNQGEEDTEETVHLDNDCTTFIDDGGIDPKSDETQDYWEKLISEITEPNDDSMPRLEPVSNIGSDVKSEQDGGSKTPASGCECLALKCIHRKCKCYKGGLGCSIHCKCEECQNTFGRKVSSQKSDSIKEVGASRDRGCHCTKLKCMDNHCKCYKLRVGCSIRCICQGCLNPNSFKQPDNNCNTPPRVKDGGIYDSTPKSNSLAFAPRVVGSSDSTVQVGATKTHRRSWGCNCKTLNCFNNYCKCYQWKVGCSIRCTCERCQNSFGKK